VLNILLVFLLFFLSSGDVRADGAENASLTPVVDGERSSQSNGHAGTAAHGTAAGWAAGDSELLEPQDEEHPRASLNATDDIVYHLDPVNVLAEKHQAGTASIKGRELQSMPSHTGAITEALKGQSNVQFSNEETSGLTAGEIRPPRVSIAGARPYETNYLIDGLSVSNTLNPTGLDKDGDSVLPSRLDVGGADQTIFYDSSLIDSVTVYSSNVPVKYGNFVGGVVDAELADPRTDRWHAVFTNRHTRSEWFDMRGTDDESVSSANQPRFRSNSLFASTDGPVTDKLALLFATSKRWSVIPLQIEENDGSFSDQDQYRSNENFFAKTLYTPSGDVKLTLDATYAPYTEERWRPAWPDSEWKIENEAVRMGGSAVIGTGWGELTAKAAWSQNGFSRDSSNNFRRQVSGTGVPEGDQIYEGGLGDATAENRGIDASLAFDLEEFATRELLWRISTGLDISNVTTDMWNEDARIESLVVIKPTKPTLPPTWTLTQADYPEYDQTKTLNTVGWYAQTEVQWARFTLTPGLRVDYDDYSFNTNLAPRLKAELDTMGDGALRLVAGASRYYGGQLRAYAFDRYRPSFSRIERSNGTVRFSEGTDRSYLAKDLDTPYSDEVMGGILGDVADFEYGLELVHRDHRNQIISKTMGDDLYEMTNDGESSYDGLTLTLARSFETERFGTHRLALGVTKSRTKTFNGAFDSEIVANRVTGGYEYDYDRVYYDGEIIDRSDVPADDYNAPTVVTLSWLGSFLEDRFRVNCVSRWKDSATGLISDSRPADETPYGTTAAKPTTPSSQWLDAESQYHDAYREGVISGGLVTDVSFELDALKRDLFTFSLLFDVVNVFNSDLHTGVAEMAVPREHVRGRGYYAGIRCEF